MTDKTIKCERCFTPVKDEEVSLVLFYKDFVPENKAEMLKKLCHECYEITKYAASPESWQSTAVPDSEKHFYFDKK